MVAILVLSRFLVEAQVAEEKQMAPPVHPSHSPPLMRYLTPHQKPSCSPTSTQPLLPSSRNFRCVGVMARTGATHQAMTPASNFLSSFLQIWS